MSASRASSNLPLAVALFLLWGGLAVCLQPWLAPTARQRSLEEVRRAVLDRLPDSLETAREHLARHGEDPMSLALAGEAAAARSDHALAIEYFRKLPSDGGRWEFHSQLGLARRCLVLGTVSEAERHLRRCLELFPNHIEANGRLGNLLQAEGRSWESARHYFVQILQGKCRGDELLGMANVERFFRSDEGLEQPELLAREQDVMMKLPVARRELFDNGSEKAETLLREIVAARPDIGEAQGRLGRIIVDRGDAAEFLQWRGNLDGAARDHPEVLFAEALQARRLGQLDSAIGRFLDVLAASPNHLGANLQIAGCLQTVGEVEAAKEFSSRASLLAELERTMNLLRGDTDEKLMVQAAETLGALGRFWEAAGWSLVMTRMTIPQEEPQRQLNRWLPLALRETGPDSPAFLPARLLDRREFGAPRWPTPAAGPALEQQSAARTIPWRFVEQARELGIDFEYFEGTREENRLEHIFNVMGGGLGAIDYDLDGWPDLYLAQANNWRDLSPQPEHTDRLYRNLQAERFVDVTDLAELGDTGFSHGVTVGDFDQDGFPDVYLGNKGPNCLYRNNGDGTFADVTQAAGVAGNEWSTSSMFADLNGDRLPDLYVLNYTLLEATALKECRVANGRVVACTPDVLTAEHDRLYINGGDGTFRDVSEAAGILVPDGRGLGVIAWDFDGNGQLGLFIANDTSSNFLFINQGSSPGSIPQFRDEGVIRGVAFDADGHSQASMGVAASDFNGDGRIDLFITTFFGDSKTMFSQREDRSFEDVTRAYALRDPGFWMLGFGSQAGDWDGDGWEDLVVTNGHVDQRSSRGTEDRMPPQLFHNLQGKRFAEVPGTELGPFFEGAYLGRGLATLDWNRDGATDFAVSHIHGPFALVTNQAPPAGRPLIVRLIGRSGCREPTGATVRASTEKGDLLRLQTAGDGFLVTNERRLHFALPPGVSTADLSVSWPGGTVETWHGVPGECEVVLIEGRGEALVQRRFSDSR